MPIMPFEGLQSESLEDVQGILPTTDADEFPIDPEDEAYYCDSILSGEHDERDAEEGDLREFMIDAHFPSARESDYAENRATRAYYGD